MRCSVVGLLFVALICSNEAVSFARLQHLQKPGFGLQELSIAVRDGVKAVVEENDREEVSFLEIESSTEGKAAFVRYVRKSYFFLLMYWPHLRRIFDKHRQLVEKNKPPPKPDPPQVRIFDLIQTDVSNNNTTTERERANNNTKYQALEPGSDISTGLAHLGDIHNSLVVLLQTNALSTTSRGFYGWLCQILVWIYRWFRYYGHYVNRNLLRIRFWVAEKHDSDKFVYRPRMSDRWPRFLMCRGNIPCLDSAFGGKSNSNPQIEGYGKQTFEGSDSQTFGGSGGAPVDAGIDLEDPGAQEDLPPFDFADCEKYVDCREEMAYNISFHDKGHEVPEETKTTPTTTLTTTNTTTTTTATNTTTTGPTTLEKANNNNATTSTTTKKNSIQTMEDLLADAEKEPDVVDTTREPINEAELESSGPSERTMERRLVRELVQVESELSVETHTPELLDTPTHSVTDDADNDGLGEADHILRGLPQDVWDELPQMMRSEEGAEKPVGRESFDDVLSLTNNNNGNEKTRVWS